MIRLIPREDLHRFPFTYTVGETRLKHPSPVEDQELLPRLVVARWIDAQLRQLGYPFSLRGDIRFHPRDGEYVVSLSRMIQGKKRTFFYVKFSITSQELISLRD